MSVRELTPPGPAGLAVLELEGEQALARLARLVSRLPQVGDFGVTRLVEAGEVLDEAVVVRRGAQHVELHVTGSPPLLRRLEAVLGSFAAPEPTTVEARARDALREARSEAAARVLLDQCAGALRRELEAHVDDPHESWRALLAALEARARVARHLLSPREVVLAGPTNAGKSTLFNALVGTDRVLVSETHGTTRDAVEADALLGPYPVRLLDTAGEREVPGAASGADPGAGAVERAGQELSRELRARAALTLWLRPADGGLDAPPVPEGAVELITRADLDPGQGRSDGDRRSPAVSALTEPEKARRVVAELHRAVLDLPREPWTAGAGVPFTAELAEGLRGLARESDSRRRRRRLLALLGTRVVDGPRKMG